MAEFSVGDVGDAIQYMLRWRGAPLDLTDATVSYIFSPPDKSASITKTAEIVGNATAGLVQYVVEDGLLTASRAGQWNVQIKVVWASGRVKHARRSFQVKQ